MLYNPTSWAVTAIAWSKRFASAECARITDLQESVTKRQFSVRIEAEVLELLAPLGVGVPQALDVDAARQAAFDGCLHQLRSKKRERERQIDLTHCAMFALCQLLGISYRACNDFVEPPAAASRPFQ